ncbi:hypothetical protein [Streptomyces sp. NA02950]|uniref:hypothetical protein n=1 Tax=Streptomyces sp. NA02950 TaxID=2742137 RepID=UPI0020CAEBD4|nr:hypothetical protein [Streptomyces sp. NA02950]
MDQEKITLSGTQETMLATLYARAVDSRSPDTVLGDTAPRRRWSASRTTSAKRG